MSGWSRELVAMGFEEATHADEDWMSIHVDGLVVELHRYAGDAYDVLVGRGSTTVTHSVRGIGLLQPTTRALTASLQFAEEALR